MNQSLDYEKRHYPKKIVAPNQLGQILLGLQSLQSTTELIKFKNKSDKLSPLPPGPK